jgi:hypothetical protein
MSQLKRTKTVPNRCPCRRQAISFACMAPEVEPSLGYLPITRVVSLRGRVVVGLACGSCGRPLAEAERPLDVKADFQHQGQCPGQPEVLDLKAETQTRTHRQSERRYEETAISVLAGCRECGTRAELATTVTVWRSEYELLRPVNADEGG